MIMNDDDDGGGGDDDDDDDDDDDRAVLSFAEFFSASCACVSSGGFQGQ